MGEDKIGMKILLKTPSACAKKNSAMLRFEMTSAKYSRIVGLIKAKF